MKPNAYHSMRRIEQVSVLVSSTITQRKGQEMSREYTLADEAYIHFNKSTIAIQM